MQNKERADSELGTITRELFIDAAPAIVYEVISDPEHVTQWWPDGATYEVKAGASGEIRFGDCAAGGKVVALTVVEALPPRTFSFRWAYAPDERTAVGKSLLVTFELVPQGSGTLVRFSETGFREMGWDAALAEESRLDHISGWDHFLPQLTRYAESLGSRP